MRRPLGKHEKAGKVGLHFSTPLTMLERAIAKGSSVCPSVCLSVTLVVHD